MAHEPRRTRCTQVVALDGWRLKLYEITTGPPVGADSVDAALARIAADLPPHDTDGPALGFAVVHRGEEGVWVLAATWHGDILHQSTYRADLDRPTQLEPVAAGGPIACVHELRVHHHEAEALVAHVLGVADPDDADADAYLQDQLTIEPGGA